MIMKKSDFLERLFDIVVSLLSLILLCPAFILVSLLIRCDSSGHILYKGIRIGKNNKPFNILKFRTMVNNAEKLGGTSTPENDPRITNLGKFLRKYKVDELPQLWNVLKGDMSIVGPRPQVLWAVELYSNEEKLLLSVKPGITDYASIKFRNEGDLLKGSSNPDQAYLEYIAPEKIRLGLEYVKKKSLWVDIKIIFLTANTLIKQK